MLNSQKYPDQLAKVNLKIKAARKIAISVYDDCILVLGL